jgi:hypothetical protein
MSTVSMKLRTSSWPSLAREEGNDIAPGAIVTEDADTWGMVWVMSTSQRRRLKLNNVTSHLPLAVLHDQDFLLD